MLTPSKVAKAVTDKLKESIAEFKFDDNKSIQAIEQIAKKPDEESGITPPWLGVFYMFDENGEVLPQGGIYNLPITIGVICSSTPGQSTDEEALEESTHYAMLVHKKIYGDYIINVGTELEPDERIVFLRSAKQPIQILQADADLSMVGVFCEYEDTF